MPYRRNLGTPPTGELIGAEPWPRPLQQDPEPQEPDQGPFSVSLTVTDGDGIVVQHFPGDTALTLHLYSGKASLYVHLSPAEWAKLRAEGNRAAERILEGE